MGYGDSYHGDVRTAEEAIGTTRNSDDAFEYTEKAKSGKVDEVHPDLNIFGRIRECCDSSKHPQTTPIVFANDVSKSRGRDPFIIDEQFAHFMGVLLALGVVPDPQVMSAAFGDAYVDRAPLQIGQWEPDQLIDEQRRKIWIEEGGGGTGEESSELLAFYLAYRTHLDSLKKRGKKGYLFIPTDEAPYPVVSRAFVRSLMGHDIPADILTTQVFQDLMAKFHTFIVFPRTTMEQRKLSIDSEIQQRVEKAGGLTKGVSIRCSLAWNNRNDLDLHCITPSGEEIFFNHMHGRCGGYLDVDANRGGDNPKDPVENIRWKKGEARAGHYRFFVRNYRYWEKSYSAIPFSVELDVEGEIQTMKGVIPAGLEGVPSQQEVFSFEYIPGQKRKTADPHANYQDKVLMDKWKLYVPESNILRVEDPASVIEVSLGAMMLQERKATLDEFIAGLKARGGNVARCKDVREALKLFASQGVFAEVPKGTF